MKALFPCVCLFFTLAGCHGKDDVPRAAPVAAARPDADDEGIGVTLKPDAQVRAGIKIQPLSEQAQQPEFIAFGKLEEDPSASFVVRAPSAGTLRLLTGQIWPALGQSVAAHTVFGQVETRLQPADRLAVNSQLLTARADLNAALGATAAAQIAFDRAKALNADNKNVSDRAVQEAAAKLDAEKVRAAGARASIQTLEASIASAATADIRTVATERGGDVVEVLAQPGESIEQGAALVRIAQLDRLVARIELPAGERLPAGSARLVATGFENFPPIPAERIAAFSASALLFRLARTMPGMRPGNPVTAHFTIAGTPVTGMQIPRSAVVQQDGRLWVYVQTKDDRFTRKPVPLDTPTPAGYAVTRGFSAGDKLVVVGAQTLLSEEFKSKNEADAN